MKMTKEEVKAVVIGKIKYWEKIRKHLPTSHPSYQIEYGHGLAIGMLIAFQIAGFLSSKEFVEIKDEVLELM